MAKSVFIYFYASSPDAAAWMLKFIFVYLTNTAVLCYSLTIICCCQEQDYIHSVCVNNSVFNLHFIKVSTENDNNFEYEKILILVDNMPLTDDKSKTHSDELQIFP
jgi:hypothetical protein